MQQPLGMGKRALCSSGGCVPECACSSHVLVAQAAAGACAKPSAARVCDCRNTYKGGKLIDAHPDLDWAANLAHMMGECARPDCCGQAARFTT